MGSKQPTSAQTPPYSSSSRSSAEYDGGRSPYSLSPPHSSSSIAAAAAAANAAVPSTPRPTHRSTLPLHPIASTSALSSSSSSVASQHSSSSAAAAAAAPIIPINPPQPPTPSSSSTPSTSTSASASASSSASSSARHHQQHPSSQSANLHPPQGADQTREAWKRRKQTLLQEASSQITTNLHDHPHLQPPVFLPTSSWLGTSSAVARPDQLQHQQNQDTPTAVAFPPDSPFAAFLTTSNNTPGGPSGPSSLQNNVSAATLASAHSAVLNHESPPIKEDIIRIIDQWLSDEGFNATKQVLMEEAGLKARERDDAAHDARKLKKALLEGDWPEVDKLVNKPLVKNHKAFLYAVYKLQFLEHIEHREYQKAFTFLAKRLKPLEHYQPHKTEYKDLCYLLSAKSITDAPSFRAWEGIQPARENLVAQFSAMMEQDRMEREAPIPGIGGFGDAYAYVPPRRLLTLFHQAVAYQVEFARYHPRRAPHVTSLLHDYSGFIVPNALSATLRGHRRNVKSVRFVGERGEKMVSGSSDTTVRLWDTATGVCEAVLEGHTSRVWEVDSTRSGSMVASAGGDGTVRIWDAMGSSGSQQQEEEVRGSHVGNRGGGGAGGNAGRGSARRGSVATGAGRGQGASGDTASGKSRLITTLRGGMIGDAYTCTFHSDERHLLAGGYDKLVRLFDINSGTVVKTFTGHQLGVSSAVFSPVGNLIVTGSKDNMVRFWDVVSGLCIGTLHDHLGEITSVRLNSSGLHLLTSSKDNSNRLWDMRMLRPLQRFKGHQNTAKNFVRASFAHTSLVVGGSEDGQVYMWEEESSEVLQTLSGHGKVGVASGVAAGSGAGLGGRRSRRGTMLGHGLPSGLGIASAAAVASPGLTPSSSFPIGPVVAFTPSSSSSTTFGPGRMLHGGSLSSNATVAGAHPSGFTPAAIPPPQATVTSGSNVVYEATWNAAQSLLASCGEDGTIRTWVFDERLERQEEEEAAVERQRSLGKQGPRIEVKGRRRGERDRRDDLEQGEE
ncbi:hypothetical protein OC861_001081 [Tilletia horrida]|nr:hypothetical protein OC861_001081 [Tilletia horrida]